METLNHIADLQLEIKNFLAGFETKLNQLIADSTQQKTEVVIPSRHVSRQELRENYLSASEFEFELNLFSRSFVSNVCREAQENGQLSSFGTIYEGDWYIMPVEFVQYVQKRNRRFSAKARRFLQNQRSFQIINEIFEKKE